jgi:DNA polymerase III delta prime subunit
MLMQMQCVLEQSATYGQGENVGLNVDHYGLNKFQSKDEDAYKSIVWMLLSLVKHIAAEKQRQLYSVPASTVETYTERHKLSLAITERLRMRHDKASVPHALAISGPSGTGKTQLALKYVEDHEHEYNPIFWIDAKDAESVLSSFERCASELQLRVSHRREHSTSLIDSSTVQAVLRWLENRKETDDAWLMVIDNADEFFWRIKKVLARGDRGSIIITSQDSQARRLVDGGCESVRVGMMERLEARTLILHHLQLDEELATGDIADDCDKVAEQLGHLALALDLAGAYISNQDTNPGEALRQYLQRYIHHKDSLLRSESFRKLLPSDQTVWTVWDTTIEKINALQRLEDSSLELPARSLLPLLARFRGAVVQDELFRLASPEMSKTCNELGVEVVELPSWLRNALAVNRKDWDDFCYERTRDRLVRYRLLQRTEGKWPGVWMHGLVRWRASKCEEEQPWEKWHLMTVLAACAKMPQMVNRFHDQGEFIAHVPRLEEAYLEGLDIGEEKKLFAWRTASLVYNNEGRWTESEELQMWIVESSKNIFGEEHPNTLKSMKVLASAYMNQGRWKQAGELHVKRLETWSRVLGDAHPSTLKCIDDLRRSYRWYGREKEALELLVRVKEMRAILA